MTNCKKTKSAPATIAVRGIVIGAVAASLAGCGMISSVVGGDKVDYKSVKKAGTLDVPPDLTQLQQDNRYSLPDSKMAWPRLPATTRSATPRPVRPSSWAPTAWWASCLSRQAA